MVQSDFGLAWNATQDMSTSGRLLGVDLGTKRIGVATCDSQRVFASPLMVLERSGDAHRDWHRLAEIADEEEAVGIIVGLPVDLRGEDGPAARQARMQAADLAAVTRRPVLLTDERLTSAQAHRMLADRGMSSRSRKSIIDMIAAQSILQGWIDRTME